MAVRCSFCSYDVERGTGKIVVKKDGTLLNFCSMKCEKNMLKLKRNPLKTPWTKGYLKFHNKLKTGEDAVESGSKKVKKGAMPKFVSEAKKEEAPKKEKPAKEEKKAEEEPAKEEKKEENVEEKPEEKKEEPAAEEAAAEKAPAEGKK